MRPLATVPALDLATTLLAAMLDGPFQGQRVTNYFVDSVRTCNTGVVVAHMGLDARTFIQPLLRRDRHAASSEFRNYAR
jgi:hypothetical protein